MNISRKITLIAVLFVFSAFSVVNAAQSGVYLGAGLNYLDLDDDSSVNISVTTGYDFYQRQLPSANIQALTLAAEAQYSDSILGTDNVVNYSLFLAARVYTRSTSRCGISVGVKSNLGKALNLKNGCSIVQFDNAA